MFKQILEEDLKKVVRNLGFVAPDTLLSISQNPQFGDYSSNVPLQLAKQKHKKAYQTPLEIANAILERLGHPNYLERVEVAGGGFLNFYLKDEALIKSLESRVKSQGKQKSRLKTLATSHFSKKILVEYAHPNTHKAFHIGHLRNVSIGESISRLLEYQGNEVFRVTYGGDIGPHVAKAMWGILKLKNEYESVKNGSLQEKGEFLGKAYAYGSKAYEKGPKIKKEIDEINAKLYGKDPKLTLLWEETKKWSIAYFESIYSRLGTEFDGQIWESEIQERGAQIAQEYLDKVFVKDQGAIIFPGEKYGLHNRVFITSRDYPTYEGKELGLTEKEQELFPYDLSLHIVDVQQSSFFEVTTKALELINQSLLGRKRHLPYGFVNLTTGKMSSREGNVITSDELLQQVKDEVKQNITSKVDEASLDKVAIAAVKFTFLKYALASEISFDIEKSVSLQGDSGPYLQYTYARINSLIKKSQESTRLPAGQGIKNQGDGKKLEEEERELLRQLEYFQGAVEEAASEFRPSQLCSYLLNLAKAFNLFYERYPILGSEKEHFRLTLSKKTAETLKLGLYLLGIETLEKM